MKASDIPKSTITAFKAWDKSAKKRSGHTKTVFIRHKRGGEEGEQLWVGYGASPSYLTGSVGVPIGISFTDTHLGDGEERMGNRSYLILAFDNDYSGTEISRYLGGVAKNTTDFGPGAKESNWASGEDDWIAPIVTGALRRARQTGKPKGK